MRRLLLSVYYPIITVITFFYYLEISREWLLAPILAVGKWYGVTVEARGLTNLGILYGC